MSDAALLHSNVIRCLITDGTVDRDERKWMAKAAHWMDRGVELLQIRERDLSARRLADLTRNVLHLPNPHGTKILLNDRADVALACGAGGVHLRDGSVQPALFARPGFLITVSCHRISDLDRTKGADYVLLAPIFSPRSKTDDRPPLGIETIRQAAELSGTPILALGGITSSNARVCIAAGAVGIAGISYFDDPDTRL